MILPGGWKEVKESPNEITSEDFVEPKGEAGTISGGWREVPDPPALESARTNFNLAARTTPDAEAKVINLASRTGWEPGLVRAQTDKAAAAADEPDWSSLHPATIDFMSAHPTNAALVKDDIPALDRVSRVDTSGFFSRRGSDIERGTWSFLASTATAFTAGDIEAEGKVKRFFDLADSGASAHDLAQEYGRLAQVEGVPDERFIRVARRFAAGELAGLSPEERAVEREKAVGFFVDRTARLAKSVEADFARVAELPTSAERQEFDRAQGIWGKLSVALSNPLEITTSFTAESLPAMVPGLVAAPVLGPAGLGIGSFFTDYASSFQQAAQEAGVDVSDPDALREAFSDPETLSELRQQSVAHAIPVSVFDAFSFKLAQAGLAEKALGGRVAALATEPARRTARQKAVAFGADVLIQSPIEAATGATGEAVGQLAAGQDLEPGAILAEALGEFGATPATVAAATINTAVAETGHRIETKRFFDAQTNLNAAVNETKLRTRSPETVEAFLAARPGDESSLSGAAIFDNREALAPVLDKLGIDAATVERAKAEGADIPVNLSAIHARLTPGEAAGILPHVRANENVPTAAEVDALRQAGQDMEDFELYQSRLAEDADLWEEMRRIHGQQFEAIKKSMLAQGMDEKTADVEAGRRAEDANIMLNAFLSNPNYFETPEKRLEAAQRYSIRYKAAQVSDFLPDPGELDFSKSVGQLITDENGQVTGRMKNANPAWYKDNQYKPGTVREAETIINKARAGEKLTENQQLFVDEAIRINRETMVRRFGEEELQGLEQGGDENAAIDKMRADLEAAKQALGVAPKGIAATVKKIVSGLKKAGADDADISVETSKLSGSTYVTYSYGEDSRLKFRVSDHALPKGHERSDIHFGNDPQDGMFYEDWPLAVIEAISADNRLKDTPASKGYRDVESLGKKIKAAESKAAEIRIAEFDRQQRERLASLSDDDLNELLARALRANNKEKNKKAREAANRFGISEGANGVISLREKLEAEKKRRENGALYQPELSQNPTGPRGSFVPSTSVTTLFRTANASTIHHEMAHFFWTEIERIIESGEASDVAKADYETVRSWLGAEEGPLTREQHEQFADGYETYLAEGKAPNEELKGAFERFKAFMVKIYRSVAAMRVQINDEMRGVYGRLLATQDEIDLYSENIGVRDVSQKEVETLGLTPKEVSALNALAAETRAGAVRALQARRDAGIKALKVEWGKQAETMAREERPHRVRTSLAAEGQGLDLDELRDNFGEESVADINGKRVGVKLAETDGQPLGVVAAQFGYDSIAEMVEELRTAPTKGERAAEIYRQIEAAHDGKFVPTDALIDNVSLDTYLREYGKVIARQFGAEEAIRAEERFRAAEGELAGRMDQGKRTLKESRQYAARRVAEYERRNDPKKLKEWAADRLAGMAMKDAANTKKFVAAFRRATNDMHRAIARGDWARAQEANEQAAINFHLANQSLEIKQFADAMRRDAQKLAKNKGTISPNYLEKIKALLSNAGLTTVQPTQPGAVMSLADLYPKATEESLALDVPAAPGWVDGNTRDFRELTVVEAMEFAEVVDTLAGMGREEQAGAKSILHSMDGAKLGDVVDEGVKSLQALKDRGGVDRKTRNRYWKKMGQAWKDLGVSSRQFLYLIRAADGFVNLGPDGKTGYLERTLYDTLARAHDRELRLRTEWAKPMMDAIAERFGKRIGNMEDAKEAKRVTTSVPVPQKMIDGGQDYWTFTNVLSIALNLGNERNTSALLAGYGMSYTDALELVSSLDEADWKVVQETWDRISQHWPEMADIYEKKNHVRPKKEKARAFTVTTAGGKTIELKGGYFPIRFDMSLDEKAAFDAQIEAGRQDVDAAFPPTTRAGFMQTRAATSGGRPISLDALWTLNRHAGYVSKYIAWTLPVKDVDRVMQHPKFKAEFSRVFGSEYYGIDSIGGISQLGTLRGLLRELAGVHNENLDGIDKAVRTTKRLMSTYLLWGNAKVVATQAVGAFPFINDVGFSRYLMGAVNAVRKNPIKAWRQMVEYSPLMAERAGAIDRDIAEALRTPRNKVHKWAVELGFLPMQFVDALIITPAWWANYNKTLDETGDHDAAVLAADKIVRASQPVTTALDQAAIQRSRKAGAQAVTWFSSATMQIGNRLWLYNQALRNGAVSPGEYTRHLILETVFPVVALSAMAVAFKGSWDDEPEDLARDAALDLVAYRFIGLPALNTITQYAAERAKEAGRGEKKKFGSLETPAARALDTLGNAVDGIIQLTFDLQDPDEKTAKKAAWALAELASIGAGIPATRLYRDGTRSLEDIESERPGIGKYLLKPGPAQPKRRRYSRPKRKRE